MELLSAVLDAASLRQRAFAQNIANVNTPNYKRLDVSFEDELAKSLKQGSSLEKIHPQLIEGTPGDTNRTDGNNVDIDLEMGNLTKNGLLYTAAAQILASRLAMLRSAITGR